MGPLVRTCQNLWREEGEPQGAADDAADAAARADRRGKLRQRINHIEGVEMTGARQGDERDVFRKVDAQHIEAKGCVALDQRAVRVS